MDNKSPEIETIYVKRFVAKGEFPKADGLYRTDYRDMNFTLETKIWDDREGYERNVKWWLEEIPIKVDGNLQELHEAFITAMKIDDNKSVYEHLQMAFEWFKLKLTLPSPDKWVSIEKDLPKNKKEVLIVDSYGGMVVGYYNVKEDQWFTSEGTEFEEVEYWKKLPEIPNELKENDEEDLTN